LSLLSARRNASAPALCAGAPAQSSNSLMPAPVRRPVGEKMRILVLAGLYPPNIIGGAEMSAADMVRWLVSQGHEIGVVTTAASPDQVLDGEFVDGVRMWRLHIPRPYPLIRFPEVSGLMKPIWHLQDHLDPRNKPKIRAIIEDFKPTDAIVHILQGLGYNALVEIGRADIPVTYILHDLGLACIRMSMFKGGRDCASQCRACQISAWWKRRLVSRVPRIGFCSPSRANIDTLAKFFPLKTYPNAVILNPNKFPQATVERVESEHPRILYVGRIQPSKGISLLLEAASWLAQDHHFTMTVVGSGPEEARLRKLYSGASWCRFAGFITQAEISNLMINSEIMCVPSIWAENSPGVVVHALSLGLPVVGSKRGGIPELIDNGRTGSLVEAGDIEAWRYELERLLSTPKMLKAWRENAAREAGRFEQATIGKQIIEFMKLISNTPPRRAAK
jgi:glycosyltransferase involved in cell wall biosynthesis